MYDNSREFQLYLFTITRSRIENEKRCAFEEKSVAGQKKKSSALDGRRKHNRALCFFSNV